MRFAHLSDCHIGGWRDTKLRDLGLKSFLKAIEISVNSKVDFILIAGDLFDTAIPQIELIKNVAEIFRELKRSKIPIYIIPGSHDFSYSGKTMIEVFDKAGLVTNVMKLKNNQLQFTIDEKTDIKLVGIYGRKNGFEIEDYKKIDFSNLNFGAGFKIFLFHTLLTELKPKEIEMIETSPMSLLPKGFDYYAGGHPHFVYGKYHENYGVIAYPGPTFPNNFAELEKLKFGSFYLVEVFENKLKLDSIPLKIKEVISYTFNLDGCRAEEVEEKLEFGDVTDKIILLRLEGKLSFGRISDINFKKIFKKLESSYVSLKNTSKLISEEEEIFDMKPGSIQEVETEVFNEFVSSEYNREFISRLILSLSLTKEDGERNVDFENRLLDEVGNLNEIN